MGSSIAGLEDKMALYYIAIACPRAIGICLLIGKYTYLTITGTLQTEELGISLHD